MSTRTGTLQEARSGRRIWLAAFLAATVMLTIAVVAISMDRDRGLAPAQGTSTNTSESSDAQSFVGCTTANTPSELSGGIPQSFVGGADANAQSFGGTTANTPSELSGGIPIYDRHQRR